MQTQNHVSHVAVGAGVFYAASGLWPVVHLKSFEFATGLKPKPAVARAFGLGLTGFGLAVAQRGRRGQVSSTLRGVAIGTALALAAADAYYLRARKGLRSVYAADALIQLGLAAAWGWLTPRARAAR